MHVVSKRSLSLSSYKYYTYFYTYSSIYLLFIYGVYCNYLYFLSILAKS